MDELKKLTGAVINLDIGNIRSLVENTLKGGLRPLEILDALRDGMEIVGDKFEKGEYFLTELVMAGETMKDAVNILEPHLASSKMDFKGKVVLGTIYCDLHDIGKRVGA